MNVAAIIVGLGNPGPRYELTRHNIGFLALDLLASKIGCTFTDSHPVAKLMKSEVAACEWNKMKVLLVKPQTFMNLSGEAIRALYMKESHLKLSQLIVLHDEVDLPFQKIRVKTGGGDAGHNGLKSIRSSIGHGEFSRVRIGVGRPSPEDKIDVADYVLQPFAKTEFDVMEKYLGHAVAVTEALVFDGLQKALAVASLQDPR